MKTRSIEEIKKELHGATQNRKKVRLLAELSDRFYFSDAIVALDYAKEGWKCSKALPEDADKALALYKYGRALAKTSEYQKAREYASESLKIYRSLSDMVETATVLNLMGNTYMPVGEYVKAMEYYTESLELAKASNQEYLMVMVLGNVGLIYFRIGEYHKSFRYQSEALELAIKIGTSDLGPSYLNLGIVYWTLREREKAEEYLRTALELGQKNNDIMCVQMSLMNMAEIDADSGRLEESLEKYEKTRTIARDQDFRYQEAHIIENLARVKSMLGDHRAALKIYDEALELMENYNFLTQIPNLLGLKAKTLLALEEVSEAMELLERGIPIAKKHREKITESEMHRELSNCHAKLQQYEEALAEYIKYSEMRDEIVQQSQEQAMAEAHIRLEIESALREREHFRLEKERLEFELISKQQELTAVALQIAKQNETLGKLTDQLKQVPTADDSDKRKANSIIHEIDRLRSNDSDWKMFESQFETIHSGFNAKLLEQYPDLTPKEVRVCALMKLNLSSKDIANTLAISQRTVEVHRLQIRKKLKLLKTDNLATHLASV